ncbi:hypothetical protein HELRODRAFT_158924 [Helobdella robusta]|uniref:Death domain-containing protein n=1 Tax=Helobdella robusta TaxID=6412 RepID=T1ENE8_HELRO|nr:hypothetical protein HELRODRAFT_158924 [Helobdella robusta]ESO12403.1 hypothetical protein HELRODRAFT_158924 [Helobdella robusta]
MTTSHDEIYKIGFDEPFRNVSELHKLELGQLLNENDDYREVSSYLGMEQELKQVQNKSNPGYEILSAWSKKNSNSTIRVLSETFKVIERNDLKEKVDEIRNGCVTKYTENLCQLKGVKVCSAD